MNSITCHDSRVTRKCARDVQHIHEAPLVNPQPTIMQTPPDSFPPGTALTVGSHKIKISQYVSQGGFAYVYLCSVDPPHNNNPTACLKRVVVPSKWQLSLLRQEVDAMKRLRGNSHIVSYIDLHALRLPSIQKDGEPQYEVLLLMEYCSGKGLIDFMNQRLTHRLTEPEIISIMSQVTTAVAMCHNLRPPLIHRDIKIENVLIDGKGTFKLCDFGSAVGYVTPGNDPQEVQRIRNDVLQNTTPQYRAPEMIDLSHGFPIDDKLDIWALGVLLYKLCYYTTPFELHTQKCLQDLEKAILNSQATLRFPESPHFSTRLKNIISCCLRGDPRRRPNSMQLLQELSQIQGQSLIPQVIPYSVRHQKLPAPSARPVNRNNVKEEKSETKVDAFAKIDKSKVLSMKPRPKSEIYPSHVSASTLSNLGSNSGGKVPLYSVNNTNKNPGSIQDLVQSQLSESTPDVAQMRHSEESDRGTLEFLRSKQSGPSRQNTGGSIKSTLVNSLRRISSGSSIKAQNSGSALLARSISKGRSSSSSENDEESRSKAPEEPKRRTSIQRRVQQLLNNKERKTSRFATGYGRYTDQEDLYAINHKNGSANASLESLNSVAVSTEKYNFERPKEPFRANTQPEAGTKALPRVRALKTYAAPPPCPPSLGRVEHRESGEKRDLDLDKGDDVATKEKSVENWTAKGEILDKSMKDSEGKQGSEENGNKGKQGIDNIERKKLNENPSNRNPSNPSSQFAQSSQNSQKSQNSQGRHIPTEKKKAPPKPSKPNHLKSPLPLSRTTSDRRPSNSSEISFPDVDDLEQQFSRRFPSYV